jgi:hypothetical protein
VGPGPTGQAHISGVLWNRVVIQWDITESPITRIILPTREFGMVLCSTFRGGLEWIERFILLFVLSVGCHPLSLLLLLHA